MLLIHLQFYDCIPKHLSKKELCLAGFICMLLLISHNEVTAINAVISVCPLSIDNKRGHKGNENNF